MNKSPCRDCIALVMCVNKKSNPVILDDCFTLRVYLHELIKQVGIQYEVKIKCLRRLPFCVWTENDGILHYNECGWHGYTTYVDLK